jgi:transketolase C-terminal domain/subunit
MVTIEDHQIKGGMGSLLTHAMLQEGHEIKVRSLGIQGDFGRSAYQADHLYQLNQMDENAIIKAVKELL